MSTDKKTAWLAGLGLLLIIVVGGIVEPCDGHSCKGDTWTNSGINTKSN